MTEGQPVRTLAEARAQLARLLTQRMQNTVPVLERTPKFKDYAIRYLESIGSGPGAKKAGSVEKEKTILARWTERVGNLRLARFEGSARPHCH
jgi:hypothetical protein